MSNSQSKAETVTSLREVKAKVREYGVEILARMTDEVLRDDWKLDPEKTSYEVKAATLVPLTRVPRTRGQKGTEDLIAILEEEPYEIYGYAVPVLEISVPPSSLTNTCTFSVTLSNDGVRFGVTCSSTG